MHARHHHVELVQELGLLVECAVLVDVDLDALEEPERCQLLVDLVHDLELAAQTLGRQALGDGQARGVVGEHHVLVAEVTGRPRHHVDGAATVGPVGVGVAVAFEGGADGVALLEAFPRRGRLGQERLEVGGLLAGQGLANHSFGLGTHPREVTQPIVLCEGADLVFRHALEGGRRSPEGPDPVRGLASALEEVSDALERLHRVHAGRLFGVTRVTSATSVAPAPRHVW